MNDQQIIIAVAKLDGFSFHNRVTDKTIPYSWDVYIRNDKVASLHNNTLPHYLTSHDAALSVIEKQSDKVQAHIWFWIVSEYIPQLRSLNDVVAISLLPAIMRKATSKQLAIALVKSCGKWEEV